MYWLLYLYGIDYLLLTHGELIERLQTQAEELGFELKYDYCKTRHQYEHSECGVYSIYFIVQLLENKKTFSEIEQSRIADEYVNSKRKYYFLKT